MTAETLPNGTVLYQDDRLLKLSADSILLAASCPTARQACDLGSGVGNVLLSIADRQPNCSLVGLEINPAAAEVCRRSVEHNSLGGRVRVVEGDLRDLPNGGSVAARQAGLPHSFDLVACNPPYLRAGSVREPSDPYRRLERVDATATPHAVSAAAAALLTPDGALCLVLRPDRLADYTAALADFDLHVDTLRYVAHDASSQPSLVLVRAKFGDRTAVTSPTLYLTCNGATSPEYQAIMEGKPCCI